MRRAADGVKEDQPITNEKIEQVTDVPAPKVDQTKTQNIAAGNISNENAERRADIGASRPPTLFGKALSSFTLSQPSLSIWPDENCEVEVHLRCRGTVFRRTCARDY